MFRRCQPRDVISHAIDLINFEGLRYELTADVLDRAFESTFVVDQYESYLAASTYSARALTLAVR